MDQMLWLAVLYFYHLRHRSVDRMMRIFLHTYSLSHRCGTQSKTQSSLDSNNSQNEQTFAFQMVKLQTNDRTMRMAYWTQFINFSHEFIQIDMFLVPPTHARTCTLSHIIHRLIFQKLRCVRLKIIVTSLLFSILWTSWPSKLDHFSAKIDCIVFSVL